MSLPKDILLYIISLTHLIWVKENFTRPTDMDIYVTFRHSLDYKLYLNCRRFFTKGFHGRKIGYKCHLGAGI